MSNLENKCKSIMSNVGYIDAVKITDSLQGSIWRSRHAETNLPVVIKITNKKLHEKQIIIVNGTQYRVYEDILKEKMLLKYLSTDETCPNSLVKYLTEFESNINYYLIMSDGGCPLISLINHAHEYISVGKIQISSWHR
eukprot:411831_1